MSFALLHKAETAQRSTRRGTAREPETMDTVETQETLRSLQGIFNELTPENLEKLQTQVAALHLDTEERLKGAVHQVFNDFLSERSYDVDHAIMCFHMLMVRLLTSTQFSFPSPVMASQIFLGPHCSFFAGMLNISPYFVSSPVEPEIKKFRLAEVPFRSAHSVSG